MFWCLLGEAALKYRMLQAHRGAHLLQGACSLTLGMLAHTCTRVDMHAHCTHCIHTACGLVAPISCKVCSQSRTL